MPSEFALVVGFLAEALFSSRKILDYFPESHQIVIRESSSLLVASCRSVDVLSCKGRKNNNGAASRVFAALIVGPRMSAHPDFISVDLTMGGSLTFSMVFSEIYLLT